MFSKNILAISIGNIIEWFEYGVYSYTVGIIGSLFFHEGDETAALLYGFAALAISFLVRPIGGWIFGSLGDKLGRKKVILITILMMAISTGLIGVLPTFESIGILATILLIVCRIGQGLSAGGEYSSSSVYMNEYADKGRRGFFASILESGTVVGYLFGILAVSCLTLMIGEDRMVAWGWRIPFLISFPLGLIAIYMRNNLVDSPTYIQLKEENNLPEKPSLEMISTAKKPMVISFLILSFAMAVYYISMTFIPSYLQTQVGLSGPQSSMVSIAGMILFIIVIPTVGFLNDRFDRRIFLTVSASIALITALPLFIFMNSGGKFAPLISFVFLSIVASTFLGTHPSTLPLLFPGRVRNISYGITYNVSSIIFGGSAAYIITLLESLTGSNLIPAYFLMSTAVLGLIGISLLPKMEKENREVNYQNIDKSV